MRLGKYEAESCNEAKNRKVLLQKVDGSVREAYGTLKENLIPATSGESRKKNDTVAIYFDTEKQSWRSFKKANLLNIA